MEPGAVLVRVGGWSRFPQGYTKLTGSEWVCLVVSYQIK